MFILFFIFLSGKIEATEPNLLKNIPDVAHTTYEENVIQFYNKLSNDIIADKSRMLESAHKLQMFLFCPFEGTQSELNLIQTIQSNIVQYIKSLSPSLATNMKKIFEDIIEEIGRRCGALEVRKNRVITPLISEIELLLGRIFVVDPVNNTVRSSSGVLIPESDGKTFRKVATCVHCVLPEEPNPKLEFYFVSAKLLDPETGLPNPEVIKFHINKSILQDEDKIVGEASTVVDKKCFIRFLQVSNNQPDILVRRITHFQPYQYFVKNPTEGISVLEHSSPRYDADRDIGFGYLNYNVSLFKELSGNIRIAKDIPSGEYEYFAIGFPSFYALNPTTQTAQTHLAKDMKMSPLTITKSRGQLKKLGDNFIYHNASTSRGMSGGPIVRFIDNENTIEILGIIQGASKKWGEEPRHRMCGF